MVSFATILALASTILAAPTPDGAGLINANVDANVAGVVDADADVHILPYYGYPSNGYPGNYPGNYYPGHRGGLLDLDLGLSLLNGYGYRRGGLLDLDLSLGLLNGLYGGHGYPNRY